MKEKNFAYKVGYYFIGPLLVVLGTAVVVTIFLKAID